MNFVSLDKILGRAPSAINILTLTGYFVLLTLDLLMFPLHQIFKTKPIVINTHCFHLNVTLFLFRPLTKVTGDVLGNTIAPAVIGAG